MATGETNKPGIDIAELKSIYKNFVEELKNADKGQHSSLPFIVQDLTAGPLVDDEGFFQVIAVGGSVYKSALAKRSGGEVILSDKKQGSLPIFVNGEDFFELVDSIILPDVDMVALNFAYPLKPLRQDKKTDGVLISGTKEHAFAGLIGRAVGKALEEYFWEKRKRKIGFAVANDSVCLLLSGLDKYNFDILGAGIVGTGFNLAFFLDDNKPVNLESGNFDKFEPSAETTEIDAGSRYQGRGIFEKETAGGYLFQHYNSIIKKSDTGLEPISSTAEMNEIALRNIPIASEAARKLFERSAALTATQIAGIMYFKKHDMTFVMEGSLFWKAHRYEEMVEDWLRLIEPEFAAKFVMIGDSALRGAARMVC